MKKIFCGMTLRCAGALLTGCALVGTLAVGLAVLGGRGEAPATHLTRYQIQFPENEQMLKDMSNQLWREAHAAAGIPQNAEANVETADKAPESPNAGNLPDIQPAAGGDASPVASLEAK
ncbi:MAG: hypothetical protein GC185_01360 [Alphaproteobacteria bacterium]|nr:hypothetical protein [Alphaproteobacteria bacterium]